MPVVVRPVATPSDVEFAKEMFRAIAKWYLDDLKVDVQFQGFSEEVDGLPGAYGPPSGCLLIASNGGDSVGCIGVRRFDDSTCEIKRLFVEPAARGLGAGLALASAALIQGKRLGYTRAVLDTGASMKAAQAVYEKLGFVDIAPYCDNPHANKPGAVRFMGINL